MYSTFCVILTIQDFKLRDFVNKEKKCEESKTQKRNIPKDDTSFEEQNNFQKSKLMPGTSTKKIKD